MTQYKMLRAAQWFWATSTTSNSF